MMNKYNWNNKISRPSTVEKITLPDGQVISFYMTGNETYLFLKPDTYSLCLLLKKELDRQHIYAEVDFTFNMGWFVRIYTVEYDKITNML